MTAGERAEHLRERLLDVGAELTVQADEVKKLAHELIALVLKELVALLGRLQARFELLHLHAGRIDGGRCHGSSPP